VSLFWRFETVVVREILVSWVLQISRLSYLCILSRTGLLHSYVKGHGLLVAMRDSSTYAVTSVATTPSPVGVHPDFGGGVVSAPFVAGT
jgi:hypothetical protein